MNYIIYIIIYILYILYTIVCIYFVLLIWVNLAMYFVSLHKQKQPLEDLTLLECGSEIKKKKKKKKNI